MTRLLFISTKNRWFFRLTLLTSLFALLIVLLSAYNHLAGITTGCPDWPQCFGSMMVTHDAAKLSATAGAFPNFPADPAHATLTMVQRYLMFTQTLLLVALTMMAALIKRQISLRPLFICLMLLVLSAGQIFLSKLAVTAQFTPLMVVGNLLNSLTILSLLWWVALITRPNSYSFSHPSLKRIRPWAWLALLFIVLQITFGGWVNYHDNCKDFPYCNVQLTPKVNWQKALHVSEKNSAPDTLAFLHSVHRVGALCAFVYLALFGFILLFNRYIYHIAFIMFTLLTIQFCMGMFDFSWLPQTTSFVSETALLSCLLLAVVSLIISLYDRPQDYWYG